MSSADVGVPAPGSGAIEPGFWQGLRRLSANAWTNMSFVANAAFIGALGTVIVGFLQYLSAYQDKVATLAKEDLAVATSALTDALNAVSLPLTLQERVVFAYLAATDDRVTPDARAYAASNAGALLKSYDSGFTALREQVMPLAVKMQLYLDLPSDPNAGPGQILATSVHSLTVPLLGYYNFDCDRDFAAFDGRGSVLKLKNPESGSALEIDWYSARNQLLTLDYCIENTNAAMGAVLQWAQSGPPQHPPQAAETTGTISPDMRAFFLRRFNGQMRRFNGFVSLAIYDMERFRAKYQPAGFLCSLPVVAGVIGLFDRCGPGR